jgi:uncharacterized membrane protein YkvI
MEERTQARGGLVAGLAFGSTVVALLSATAHGFASSPSGVAQDWDLPLALACIAILATLGLLVVARRNRQTSLVGSVPVMLLSAGPWSVLAFALAAVASGGQLSLG